MSVTARPRVDRHSEWIRSPRWVRVRFASEIVADSTEMMLLRQHGFLPVYYFPAHDVRTDLLVECKHTTFSPYKGTASYFDVRVGDRAAPAAAWTYRDPRPGSPDTRGYYSFHWHAMDAWLEEDEVVSVHARDPYLRAETLSSSRHVVVRLGGEVVAETDRPVLLLETGLVTRYYIPPADVRLELFEPSPSYSMCPYKGTARYRSFDSNGVRIDDAAWYYPEPLRDVLKIANHLCFWNERSDTSIEVDGDDLPRLGIRQSAPGSELLYRSRRFFAVPPPGGMRHARAGELQHDFARPNGRVEGPPDEEIEMDVERAGGRRPSSLRLLTPRRPGATGGRAETSLFFTFGRSDPPAPPNDPALSGFLVDDAEPVDLASAPVCERELRRVRGVAGGTTFADSREAILYVGDDDVAVYFFPPGDVRRELLVDPSTGSGGDGSGRVTSFTLRLAGRASVPNAAYSYLDLPAELGALRGMIAFHWDAAEAWFEEDDEVRGHPRVPYHRADAVHSSRHVVVSLDGRRLAESRRCVALFETGEPARFYLPRLDADMSLLVDGGRHSRSPYLGEAHRYSALIDEEVHPDVAWSYRDPVSECPKIADLLCFDGRRVEVRVDPPVVGDGHAASRDTSPRAVSPPAGRPAAQDQGVVGLGWSSSST